MRADDLQQLMLSDSTIQKIFGGIFPRDKLPDTLLKKPIIFIINTDHSRGNGIHWVCVYIGLNGVGEYWDSFGFDIRYKDILTFVNKHCIRYNYNNLVLQPTFSETCG